MSNSQKSLIEALKAINNMFADMAGVLSPTFKANYLKETALLIDAIQDPKTIVHDEILVESLKTARTRKEAVQAAINNILEKIDIQKFGGDYLLGAITQYMRHEVYTMLPEFKNIILDEQVLASTSQVSSDGSDSSPLDSPKRRTIPGETEDEKEQFEEAVHPATGQVLRREQPDTMPNVEEPDKDSDKDDAFISSEIQEPNEWGLNSGVSSQNVDYPPGGGGWDSEVKVNAHPEMTNYHHGAKVNTTITPRRGEYPPETQAKQMGLNVPLIGGEEDLEDEELLKKYQFNAEDIEGNIKKINVKAITLAEAKLFAQGAGYIVREHLGTISLKKN